MFTLKTKEATQYTDESGNTLLAVPFDIVNEAGETVTSMNQSFPLNASADDIKAMLSQHVAVYTEDSVRYEAGKEQQEALEASTAVIAEVSNLTVGAL
jgi:hypothetical protein